MKITVQREDETTVYGIIEATGQWVKKDRQAPDGWMAIEVPEWAASAEERRSAPDNVKVTHVPIVQVTRIVRETRMILAGETEKYLADGWAVAEEPDPNRVPIGKLPRN